MKCLCCNKELNNPSEYEASVQWHEKCIRSFFGTDRLPELEISEKQLEELALNSVNKGLTVPGVQKKLSLHLSVIDDIGRFTIVGYPAGYILKPQSPEYRNLPEAEYLVMKMAESAGISIVPCALVKMSGEYAYITKRVDRDQDRQFAMEDFCQLAWRTTADKYKGSYEKCGKIILRHSKNSGLDIAELFFRLIFCFITGNSDMHYKNFSLIENIPGGRVYGLSPAYDLLPVNIILPSDTEETALMLNGKKKNLRYKDFIALAANYGISEKRAAVFIKRLTDSENVFLQQIWDSYLPENMKTDFIELVQKRCAVLRR